ncbi:MAG TPA: hypothetical protein VN668_13640 [Stellaceae bacterium]|nr:hypothetical protein [Stellaceae bacterium]
MHRRLALPLRWARDGALLALALSVAALFLPLEWGGYPGWSGGAMIVQNLAAVAVRIAVFALIAVMLGSLWSRIRHRRHQGHAATPRRRAF